MPVHSSDDQGAVGPCIGALMPSSPPHLMLLPSALPWMPSFQPLAPGHAPSLCVSSFSGLECSPTPFPLLCLLLSLAVPSSGRHLCPPDKVSSPFYRVSQAQVSLDGLQWGVCLVHASIFHWTQRSVGSGARPFVVVSCHHNTIRKSMPGIHQNPCLLSPGLACFQHQSPVSPCVN